MGVLHFKHRLYLVLPGQKVSLASPRQLNDLLSRACDEVYTATPRWRNELINRRALSSSAAAARRNLIEAMFEHPEKEALGFEGTPPERSIYETLLKGSRLHRKHGGEMAFTPPDAKADQAVKEIWKAIEQFLADTEGGRRSVEQLFVTLRQPPFGLKDGVLPVLLAAVLVHAHTQVALDEEGSFVPRPSAAVFERLFQTPATFELQRFRIAGPRAEVFQQYAAMIQKPESEATDILTVVNPMVRLAKDLPDFVLKTKQISEAAQRVLKTVREARQPDKLLFLDLPAACGYAAFEASGKVDQKQVDGYFAQLRAAFAELQRAYPHLLGDIERLILKACDESAPLAPARKRIDHHARLVLNVAVDANPAVRHGPAGVTKLGLMVCPSAPDRTPDYGPYFSGGYVSAPPGLLGATDYAPLRGLHAAFESGCATASPAAARDGMLAPFQSRPRIADATDGTTNTLLFVERAGLQQVYSQRQPVTPNTPGTPGWHLNAAWADYNIAKELRGTEGALGTVCRVVNGVNVNAMYSFHTGGVNVVRGDGSLGFLRDATDPAVVGALVTRAGNEVVGNY